MGIGRKVSVVGAGFVGATTAQRIVEKNMADVVLVDVVEGLPQGKALDMMQSAPVEGFRTVVTGTNDFAATEGSDIIVMTAGIARKPGMSRDDLLQTNAKIVREVIARTARLSPKAVFIIVTNPLDVMSYLAYKISGFEPRRVIGMAGVLDSARYRYFIAEALGVPPQDVEAMVLGGHGDLMVPLTSTVTVKGMPAAEFISRDKIEAISRRTKDGGAEIVKLLKTGSAYYAPAASVAEMVRSILFDERRILPCSVYLQGQYGLRDVYCGVPVRLSRGGAEDVVELRLSDQESSALAKSAGAIREEIGKLDLSAS